MDRRDILGEICESCPEIIDKIPMIRDSHQDQIERWAEYVRTNKDWKKHHTAFINALFDKANETINKLAKQPGGPDKIAELYNIKNRKGYPSIFKEQ